VTNGDRPFAAAHSGLEPGTGKQDDARPHAAQGNQAERSETPEAARGEQPEVTGDLDAAAAAVDDDLLEVIGRERDDYRDALVRLQADFENYKKRVRSQEAEVSARATESLVERLLPVLDTADLAQAHGGGEDVRQVCSALQSALEREGLERIDPAGQAFDPTLHEAVAHEPGEVDGGAQEVSEVLRAGYRWKGRVLRAAMVKVRG
jgi:molecular chaperone GrpE